MSFTWGPLSSGGHLLLTPAGTSTGFHYTRLLQFWKANMIFYQSEGTAARRRFPVYLVDATDGITPETGESGGQPQISKAGGAWSDTTATLTSIGNGAYYVELTATELNTLGTLQVRYKSAATAEFSHAATVVAIDIHDSVRAGLTALPNAAAEASGGLITRGTGTGQFSVSSGVGLANVSQWNSNSLLTTKYDLGVYSNGTMQSGSSSTTAVLSAFQSEASDVLNGAYILIWSGTGLGQAPRLITDWDSLTQTATIQPAWAVTPDNTTVYALMWWGTPFFPPTVTEIADQVWDEAISGHATAGSTGALLSEIDGQTNNIASQVWDVPMASHIGADTTGEALNATPDLTVQDIVDGVWDEPAADHDTDGTMGANLQALADAVLVWPTPIGGGVTASTLIQRAMAISDMHDNFVSETEWLNWLNQEQYALRLFLARAGWQLPFDTTTAVISTTGWSLSTNGGSSTDVATDSGHYVFTPTLADVMALVCVHQSLNGRLKLLHMNNAVDFLRQPIGGTNSTGNALEYRCRMYGNEIHMDFYPTPVTGETYLITYLSAPVPLTGTDQAVALPMGWEERLVLGMARRALIKEESDPSQIERLIRDMDSQIEQLCWNRVTSESPRVRNTDPNVGTADLARWQDWWWR